jgi:hypothetical protein
MGVEPRPGFEQPVAQVGVRDVFMVVMVGFGDPVAFVPSLALFEVSEHQQGEVWERNRGQRLGRVVPQSHGVEPRDARSSAGMSVRSP